MTKLLKIYPFTTDRIWKRYWCNPLSWLNLLCCLWIGQVFAIGESCDAIWTKNLRATSAVPTSVCFSSNTEGCYNVSGATTINSLPNSLVAGDYKLTASSIPINKDFTASSATVRIFVDGSLTIGNNAELNWGGPAQNLLIVVSGALTIGNNVKISGFVLAGGSVDLGNSKNTAITGGLTAKGAVSGGKNGDFIFNSSALSLLNGGVICAGGGIPATEIDHFEFSYSGQALTCKAEVFTIKACNNAACTELVTEPISATLSPVSGWISGSGLTGGNVLNFSGGTATATLAQTTPATVVVGVSDSVPLTKPFSTTLCQIGISLSAANCSVPFADSGLVFSIPDKLAAKPASGIEIQALESAGNQTCQPSFVSVNRTIHFWSTYQSPLAPGLDPSARVTVSQGSNSSVVGVSEATATSMQLNFDAQGKATIAVNYNDAGQLQLDASYLGSVDTDDAGLVLHGADTFVSAPHGLCITAEQYCSTPSADCSVYKKAGENFTITLSARAWEKDIDPDFCNNGSTPSFSLNAIPLRHSLIQPEDGVAGALSQNNYNHAAQVNAQTPVTLNLSEVGIFKLHAGDELTYLGMPITLGSSMINPLGRIVPDRFVLDYSKITSTCDKFHYLSQPALLDLTVDALNHEGEVTQNYHGAFAKATAALAAENNNNKVDLTPRIQPQPTLLAWEKGRSERTSLSFSLLRTTIADGSFESVLFGLLLLDEDGSPLVGLDQRTDTDDNCEAADNCLSKTLDVAKPWRYGRLQIVNALGSEQSNLPVQLKAEYWNGQQFVPSTDDSCSPVEPTRLLVTGETPGAPVLIVSGNNSTLQNGSSAAFDLLLSPPGIESPDPLIYLLQYQLNDYPWLQYDWVPNNAQLLENPQAEAVFGGFRGNNRQIFWREN